MSPLHTHYDNLKVARNAPPELIRAAYRLLAQRYHPDVNPSPDATRVMEILNGSYAVLSDPNQRAAHDAWIEDQLIKEALEEAEAHTDPPREKAHQSQQQEASSPSPAFPPTALDKFTSWQASAPIGTHIAAGCALMALVIWSLNTPSQSNAPPVNRSPSSEPEQLFVGDPRLDVSPPPMRPVDGAPASVRELPAGIVLDESSATRWSPTGRPWPTRAAYLNGFQRLATSGLSTLTIDNASGGADVYVKLCRASADRCEGLRHVFIPLGASFTSRITPGTYDIRYRSLDSGALAKSEPMELEQIESGRGTSYSTVRLTLYRVAGGNTTFESLPEDKF